MKRVILSILAASTLALMTSAGAANRQPQPRPTEPWEACHAKGWQWGGMSRGCIDPKAPKPQPPATNPGGGRPKPLKPMPRR